MLEKILLSNSSIIEHVLRDSEESIVEFFPAYNIKFVKKMQLIVFEPFGSKKFS